MSPYVIEPKSRKLKWDADLWITGLGSQYPPYLLDPEKLDALATRFYNVESPGLKKLLEINKRTGIDTRSAISTYEDGFGAQSTPPTIDEMDEFFREHGVDLATQACRKALREWGGRLGEITHTVGVTCTNQGNPGYDLLVCRALQLHPGVDRTLLHGVGCAGGLAIMRAAAQLAAGATARGKPARILAFACELCTINVRCELAAAEKSFPRDVSVAGALFSDGAAAFVLCNSLGLGEKTEPLFSVVDWSVSTLPDTVEHMSFYTGPYGFQTVLTRDIPGLVKQAIKPIFDSLVSCCPGVGVKEGAFDWALHPGGQAVLEGVKDAMGLKEEQLRASREIYRTRGNSSSPTVLAVLDKLRSMGEGRDHVIATSFGPGLCVEMVMLERCR